MKSILSTVLLFFSATAVATEALQQIDMQSVGLNTFYVLSTIEGVGEASLLVDTGSGYSIINQETLERLQEAGEATYLRKLEGVMADGSHRIVSMYRIAGMTIGSTCHVRDIEVVVFPSGTRQILGLSTLSKVSPFMFSTNPPMLSLSHCESA